MLNHGGDLVGFEEEYGVRPLNFSVNTNPLGPPAQVRQALEAAAARAGEYPDPLCRRLGRAIARHEGVPEEWVLCGNGAADLIWRLALGLRPGTALVTAPTFSEYEAALTATGCQVRRHLLTAQEDFRLTDAILEEITPGTELVFLCNPNNPTGLAAEPGLLAAVLERCEACGALLAVDECFMDFLPDARTRTMKPRLGSGAGLLILKALTKTHALAGLRLGYCLCAGAPLLETLRRSGQSWPVSVAAEEAGVAALADRDYLRRTREFLVPERERVRRALERLGLKVYPGQANYLLFYTADHGFGEKLARRGILLRDCRNYPGLGPGYYRTAIRGREDNTRLLAAVEAVRSV